MLTELCQDLRNWFEKERFCGKFKISGGSLTAPFLREGQYFRIVGSMFSDGVYRYPVYGLTDEEFVGEVWSLAIPKDFLDLVDKIKAWQEKYESVDSPAMSPFNSESFGGYSYTKNGTGNGSSASSAPSYKTAFAAALNRWRKI